MQNIEFVEPKVEIIDEYDPLKKIELCGRVCYKSEEKICEGSAERLISSIIKRGHTSVLEHYRIAVEPSDLLIDFIQSLVHGRSETIGTEHSNFKYFMDYARFLEFNRNGSISGNVRAWRNMFCNVFDRGLNNFKERYGILFNDIDIKSDDNECGKCIHEDSNYATVRITTNRGVSHELVRHRVFSFSQESTRYCNYGGSIKFVLPHGDWPNSYIDDLKKSCEQCASLYCSMINNGIVPQMARNVLNNSLKTEVVMTGTYDNWREFLRLRYDVAAHPEMKWVAQMIKEKLF